MAKNDSNITSIDDPQPQAILEKTVEIQVADYGDDFCGRKAELTIQAGHDKVGKQAVFVAINTIGFHIPRDIPVIVPVEVIEVLNNAIEKVYEPQKDQTYIERNIKRYAYSVTYLAPPDGK